MLTLRHLEIDGFGPFADPTIIDFAEQGVTVIYGDNARGKTSLMRALRFALLGTPSGGLASLPVGASAKPWIVDACNRDRVTQGIYRFQLRLAITFDEVDWEIARSAAPRNVDSPPTSDADMNLTVAMRRDGYVAGPDERGELLSRIMPLEISRFFLFDGELLNQYAELLDNDSEIGRRISEAVEHILGVPVLKRAREQLTALASSLDQAVATEASKSQRTEQLGTALKQALDLRTNHEQQRDQATGERAELIERRESLEARMRHQDLYAKALERRDKAQEDIDFALVRQQDKRTELQAAMRDGWRTLLEGKVRQARARSRQTLNAALGALHHELRTAALEAHHCEICDQDLSQDAYDSLLATAREGRADSGVAASQAVEMMRRVSALDQFASRDVRREVAAIWSDLSRARMDEVTARSALTDAEQTLEGQDHNDVRQTIADWAATSHKIEALDRAIDEHDVRVDAQDQAIDRFTRDLRSAGTSSLAEVQERAEIAKAARDTFRTTVEAYKSTLRARVERSATDLFLRMTTEQVDYERLSINEHYGLSIVHTDGQHETGRSAGQEQVVALALMGALQANAPLRGPIVMDTPFGRLDSKHTKNVVTTLPTMAEQLVLFIQEDEISRSDVRDYLGSSLRKEYELERLSARRTKVIGVRG